MVRLIYIFTLCISQLIFCISLDTNNSPVYKDLIKKCPNITKNQMVQECSIAKTAGVLDITDSSNVNNVLCTVYLYNMWKFIDNPQHKCGELFSNHENYNSTICEKPEFLITNLTDRLNQLESVRIKCDKLCIYWNQTIDVKCNAARYYYDQLDKLHTVDIQESSINNSSLIKDTNRSNGNQPKVVNGTNTRSQTNNATIESVNLNETVIGTVNDRQVLGNNILDNIKTHNEDGKEKGKEDSGTTLDINIPKVETSNYTQVQDLKEDKLNDSHPMGNPDIIKDNKAKDRKDVGNEINSNRVVEKYLDESDLINNPLVENEDEGVIPYTQEDDEDSTGVPIMEKPNKLVEDNPVNNINTDVDEESYFFSYFMVVCILFVMGYVFYHNRAKVMAMVMEGKRNRRQFRNRRPNSANYHKLDSNLEEALTSTCNKNSNQIIY